MSDEKRKSIFATFAGFGAGIFGKVQSLFASGGGADEDEAPVLVDEMDDDVRKNNPVPGFGYNISFCHYESDNHGKPFFYTAPLGDPFPSYHTSPMPDFPARWTLIDGVKMPCESLTAPRIRLSPIELKQKHGALARIRSAASAENNSPKPRVLNLSHQCLGDPYQYEAFVTFWDINKSAEVLNLCDNELDDITDLDLSHVKMLYASRNNFASFFQIPDMPECEELYLNNNFLTGVRGMNQERFPKLKKIQILHNPVEEMGEKHKQKITEAVPTLEWFNDVPVKGW